MSLTWTNRPTSSCVILLGALLLTGCSSVEFFGYIPAVPAHRVPQELLGVTRADMQELTLTRLRQDPPEVYQLGPGDVLGVYVENVLGQAEEPPVVHFPENEDRPPEIGYPIPVREDGTIALPLVPAIKVAGLSLTQTTDAIRRAYTHDRRILKNGQDRILVSLMRRRTYRVLVVREESGATDGVTKRGTGLSVDLPAYENDVLHALNMTGGLPGLDAKNEIVILRGRFQEAVERDKMIAAIGGGTDQCGQSAVENQDKNTIRIPLRFRPDNVPEFTQDDILLTNGDIVMIRARDREIFYTGGVLGGGQFPLPRDYDLDVLGAIAIADGPLGSGGTAISQIGGSRRNRGALGRGGVTGIAPSRAIVLRKTPDGGQVPIYVNLNKALVDPKQRILIQPEDVIVVKYTMPEEIANVALGLIQFNFLLNGFNGGGF